MKLCKGLNGILLFVYLSVIECYHEIEYKFDNNIENCNARRDQLSILISLLKRAFSVIKKDEDSLRIPQIISNNRGIENISHEQLSNMTVNLMNLNNNNSNNSSSSDDLQENFLTRKTIDDCFIKKFGVLVWLLCVEYKCGICINSRKKAGVIKILLDSIGNKNNISNISTLGL